MCKKHEIVTKKSETKKKKRFIGSATGADAIKKFTPSLGVPSLGV